LKNTKYHEIYKKNFKAFQNVPKFAFWYLATLLTANKNSLKIVVTGSKKVVKEALTTSVKFRRMDTWLLSESSVIRNSTMTKYLKTSWESKKQNANMKVIIKVLIWQAAASRCVVVIADKCIDGYCFITQNLTLLLDKWLAGWPDWANFRPKGDILLWAVFKLQKYPTFYSTFFMSID
jgi:hypothetical protein